MKFRYIELKNRAKLTVFWVYFWQKMIKYVNMEEKKELTEIIMKPPELICFLLLVDFLKIEFGGFF